MEMSFCPEVQNDMNSCNFLMLQVWLLPRNNYVLCVLRWYASDISIESDITCCCGPRAWNVPWVSALKDPFSPGLLLCRLQMLTHISRDREAVTGDSDSFLKEDTSKFLQNFNVLVFRAFLFGINWHWIIVQPLTRIEMSWLLNTLRPRKEKLPIFCRWHFEIDFLEWKCSYFDLNFTEFCSWGSS